MFLTFSKNPRWYTEKEGNQEPKICILVLVMCIIYIDCDIGDLYLSYILSVYSDCVYDIGRFIVYLSYILSVYFFVGSGVGILVVYLVSVY